MYRKSIDFPIIDQLHLNYFIHYSIDILLNFYSNNFPFDFSKVFSIIFLHTSTLPFLPLLQLLLHAPIFPTFPL